MLGLGNIFTTRVLFKRSGLLHYNYKGTYIIALLALVDANEMFRYLDNGKNGRVSDGGVYRDPQALSDNYSNIPYDRSPEGYGVRRGSC